jgi:MFS family permease
LDKQRSIAGPGFNRWLVPPAALAVHLSIGQVYSYSVFKVPLSHAIGITRQASEDWRQEQIAWMFSIAIAMLGISTAVFGRWIERNGPRRAMFISACCFALGFLIAAFGVYAHQLWLIYLGYGFVGGIGLGFGYLAPVATLVKWFPDRPGLATGLAIMGFGGGAMIGSPLDIRLMQHFRSPESVGAWQAMVCMGIIYIVFMMFGVFTVRIPAENWRPAGWTPKVKQGGMITTGNVSAHDAVHAPQFWLQWLVLFTNTTAGIGIIEQASPMIQEMFPGRVLEAAAGGFVGLLSLFNMGGRFFWSSTSDYVGRKNTFMCFFLLGAPLYFLAPYAGVNHLGNVVLFVAICCVLLSMYGGGFATLPAYVRDLFGQKEFSPIYGRELTAWSAAGVVGPVLVNYIRRYRLNQGAAPATAYSTVLWVMAGILVVGLICNFLIRPVAQRATIGAAGPTGDVPHPGATAGAAMRGGERMTGTAAPGAVRDRDARNPNRPDVRDPSTRDRV